MSGSFDVVLDDGLTRDTITLNRSYFGVYVPSLVWRELENFSSGSVCLVLASHPYDAEAYHRDYDEFLRAAAAGAAMSDIEVADPRAALLTARDERRDSFDRVLDGGRYILGAEVEAFEREWAERCSTAYAVGVSSGTDALALALRAVGVERRRRGARARA